MSKCILQEISETTPTRFWNDTCDAETLRRAVGWGATGATSNPVLVLACVRSDPERWAAQVANIRKAEKHFSEIEIAWELIRLLAVEAFPILRAIYDETGGKAGRVTVQVNPKYYTSTDKMIEHATQIAEWGENVAIKIPAVEAGFPAMEELVAKGFSILSTVQYSVPQAIASAEAFERGYKRAQANGIDTSRMNTWAAIMVGRLDVVATLPPEWQVFINDSDETINPNAIDQPEPDDKIARLRKHFPDFIKAYEEDGMAVDEFYQFGSSRKTLRQFIGGYEDLLRFVRDCML